VPASGSAAYDLATDSLSLHHDLFVELIESVIKREGGTYRGVAQRSGLSERYLELVRSGQRAVPPPATLERVLAAIPGITPGEAASLREFARRARRGRRPLGASRRLVLDEDEVRAELGRLLHAHHEALHDGAAELVVHRYRDLLQGVLRLLGRIGDPAADPATVARLYLLRCNVANVLDDPVDGLRSARVAERILAEHAERHRPVDPELAGLRVESLRAAGMTLHNMKRDRAALERYRAAEALAAPIHADRQRAYILLDSISAVAGTRRFRIGDVKKLAEAIYRECDRGVFEDGERDLLILRTERGLANAYVRHGDLRSGTARLLADQVERVERTPMGGPLHRVQVYRTVADFAQARGDRRVHEEMLGRALRTAEAAGLDHQLRQLRHDTEQENGTRLRRVENL
jgi:transcriptional regulator with XRE-family HTH domain